MQIESATAPGFLNRYKLLLLTYEGQKPPTPEFHTALAKWVRAGGALVVVDDDSDPYNAVREWWNTAPNAFATPREHLFEALGLAKDATGLHKVGRGVVVREALSPAALTYKEDGAETVRKAVRQAAAAVKLAWKETDSLVLRRGPYLVAAGLDESTPGAKPYVLHGRYLNLFDPELAVLNTVTITPADPHVVARPEQRQARRNEGSGRRLPCARRESGRPDLAVPRRRHRRYQRRRPDRHAVRPGAGSGGRAAPGSLEI